MKRFWPYLAFIFIWFVFSYPFFLQGRVPAPLDFLVNFFAPWDKYYDFPIKNPAISDVVNQIIPWKTFTAWSLQRGEIPLWNPYNLAGAPHLANWQSGVLYPTNLFFLIFPFTTAWGFHVLLQPLFAGLFTILYLRSLSISKTASLLGALAFSYGGFMTTWLEWGTLGHALLWLPLALYGVERIAESLRPELRSSTPRLRRSSRGLSSFDGEVFRTEQPEGLEEPRGVKRKDKITSSFITVLAFVMSLFAGHLQISLYVIATTIAYFIFRTWDILNWRSLLHACLPTRQASRFTLLAILLASPQLFPSFHLYQHSYRSESIDEEWFKNFRIPLYGLATFIAPDFFGNPVTRNHWSDHSYVEMMGYVGIVPSLFALFAISHLKRSDLSILKGQTLRNKRSDPDEGQDQILDRIRRFFIWVIIIAFAFSLKTPFANILLWLNVPVLSSSSPARIIGIVTFSFAVLAAIGMDELLELIKNRKWKPISFFLSLVSISFLILWGWVFFSGHEFSAVSQRNLIFPTGVFIGVIGFIGIIGKIDYFVNNRHIETLLASCLMLLAFLDLFRFHHKFTPFTDPQYFYPEIPVTRWLRDHPGRTFGLFDANLNLPFRIATVEGYDPLVLGDYVRYTATAETGELILPKRTSAVQLPKNGKNTMRILNELGVKYVIQPTVHGAQPWELQLWNYPGQFVKIYEDDQYEVHENLFAKEPIEPFTDLRATQNPLFMIGVLVSVFTTFGMLFLW